MDNNPEGFSSHLLDFVPNETQSFLIGRSLYLVFRSWRPILHFAFLLQMDRSRRIFVNVPVGLWEYTRKAVFGAGALEFKDSVVGRCRL
jgi:hypothetical protein